MSVKEWADEHNINLVFLNPQPMYTFKRNEKGELVKNELTDLLLAMLSYGAMMEMKIKQERFKTSKESLRAAGKVSVGKPMYGYYKAADKSIQINDEEADVISNLFEDYLNTSTSLKLLYENYVAKGKLSNIKGLTVWNTNINHKRTRKWKGHVAYIAGFHRKVIDRVRQDKLRI